MNSLTLDAEYYLNHCVRSVVARVQRDVVIAPDHDLHRPAHVLCIPLTYLMAAVSTQADLMLVWQRFHPLAEGLDLSQFP